MQTLPLAENLGPGRKMLCSIFKVTQHCLRQHTLTPARFPPCSPPCLLRPFACRGLNSHPIPSANFGQTSEQSSRQPSDMGFRALLLLPLLLAAAPAPAVGAEEPGGGSALVPDKLERQTGTVAPVRQAEAGCIGCRP